MLYLALNVIHTSLPCRRSQLFHCAPGNGRERSAQSRSSGLLSTDNQLYEALTLLKGINVLGLRDSKTADTEPLASTAP